MFLEKTKILAFYYLVPNRNTKPNCEIFVKEKIMDNKTHQCKLISDNTYELSLLQDMIYKKMKTKT